MKVGFIGLRIMGSPMSMNLIRAGHELVINNRSRSKADHLIAQALPGLTHPPMWQGSAQLSSRCSMALLRSVRSAWVKGA